MGTQPFFDAAYPVSDLLCVFASVFAVGNFDCLAGATGNFPFRFGKAADVDWKEAAKVAKKQHDKLEEAKRRGEDWLERLRRLVG